MPTVRKVKPLPEIVDEQKAIESFRIADEIDRRMAPYKGLFKLPAEALEQLDFPEKQAYVKKYGEDYSWTAKEVCKYERHLVPYPSINSFQEIYRNYVNCARAAENEPTRMWEQYLGSKWAFKGFAYEVNGLHTDDEIRLLILEDFDKERRLFEKLKFKFDSNRESESTHERMRIPENVRVEVWRRDGGKCARCGSRERLEYDHIIPVSQGGSNTTRNIELLCEKHNRSKSDNPA